jgi:hypothetical protein
MSELTSKDEIVQIVRLDNGFALFSDTNRATKSSHYCSNLKGVVAELHRVFEGSEKLTKDQLDYLKGDKKK